MNFNYQITEQDYFNAVKLHQRNRQRHWQNEVVIFGFCLLLGFFFVFNADNMKLVGSVVVFLFALIGYSIVVNKKKLKKEYQYNTFLKLPIALSVTDEGCLQSGEDYQVLLRWEYIYRYIESDQYWVIYTTPSLMHIIPKLSVSESEQQQFSEILKQQIGERGKLDKTMCNLNARKANNQK